MPPRETFGWIVVGLAILAAVILLTWTLPAVPSTRAPLCGETAQEIEQARQLARQGVDDAMKANSGLVFRNWIGAGIERQHARAGFEREFAGYFYARHVLEQWQIPLCK